MPTEENKARVLHFLDEVFSKRNTAAFLDFGAPNVVCHLAGVPQPFHGPGAVQEWATQYLLAFDPHLTVEEIVAEGDGVVVRWKIRGTHKGDYLGVPPTGRQVAFTALEMFQFADGKCQEVWIMFDTLGVVQQLGLFPKGRPPRALLRFILWLQRLGGRWLEPRAHS